MADPIPIPASLRQADITRFVNRANQLRPVKPEITYWCEYWVVNQILSKQLHNTDEESLNYTTNLMDQLERTKAENPIDAILDDAVGQAVVEDFAQTTFARAEKVLYANRVSRQTADTFDAAATFFQLLNVWGETDLEIQKKIKYAKWNAARILKAVREGKDPNESNPRQQEPEPEEALPALDPNDPDVQQLTGLDNTQIPLPKAATVEDDPDAEFYTKQGSTPAAAPNVPTPPLKSPSEMAPSALSTTDPSHPPVQTPSGGYFPNAQFAPSPLSQTGGSEINLPNVPSAPSPDVPSGSALGSPWSDAPTGPAQPQGPPVPHPAQPKPQTYAPPPPVQHAPVTVPTSVPTETFDVEGDIPGATKHARFAISALNFEDVPTAVKELRAALAALGAKP